MSDEQFNQLMGKLDRIIELLEKEQAPKSYSVINERGLPNHHMLNSYPPNDPLPLVEAIGKPIE
jgi:hypothetical protein